MNKVITCIATRALEPENSKPSVNAEPESQHTSDACFTLGKWCGIVAAGYYYLRVVAPLEALPTPSRSAQRPNPSFQ